MRGERVSSGYEVVFVVTEAQRDAYVEAARAAMHEGQPVRIKVVRTKRFGEPGYSIGTPTRAEWTEASRAVFRYIDQTFPVGTRIKTVRPLIGREARPAGALATVTATEGYGYPMVTFDGDTGGPYHVGPWWYEAIG